MMLMMKITFIVAIILMVVVANFFKGKDFKILTIAGTVISVLGLLLI